jgi:hypothetical protein
MGLYDNPEYRQKNKEELPLKMPAITQKMLHVCVRSWTTNLHGWQTRWQLVSLPTKLQSIRIYRP